MKFLLDTNFLMLPAKFKVDVFSDLSIFGKPELYTLDLVITELEGLAEGAGKDAMCARVALILVKRKRVKIKKSHFKNADKEIIRVAKKDRENWIVCTQDEPLVKKLKKAGVFVIGLRQKRYLMRW